MANEKMPEPSCDVNSHAPAGYDCPFCRNAEGSPAEYPLEVIYRDDDVFVKMNPRWRPNNPGAALVIPIEHFESIYDLPASLGAPVQHAARSVALAMKYAFGCDGVSTRQHNGPAGDQDVWHYHLHVIPRWENDAFNSHHGTLASATEIRVRADQIRRAWPSPT